MKKSFLMLIFLFCQSAMQASVQVLSEAIVKSDITQVQKFLQENSLSALEKQAFLDLAQETIIGRRHEIDSQLPYALGKLITIGAAWHFARVRWVDVDMRHTGPTPLTRLTELIFVGWFLLKELAHKKELAKQYSDAVTIKQLIWLAKTI